MREENRVKMEVEEVETKGWKERQGGGKDANYETGKRRRLAGRHGGLQGGME